MPGIGIGAALPFMLPARGGGVDIPPTLVAVGGDFLFTGQDAGVLVKQKLVAAAASFAFTGQSATLSAPLGSKRLNADAGSFAFSGDTMTPVVDYKVSGAAGSFAVTGTAATFRQARKLAAAATSFAFTGQATTLTKSNNYTGPGDVVSGAYMWFSPARAYNAAFAAAAGAVMDLVDQAGANPITINILTSGFVDTTAINNWVTANSVTTIKVAKLYDQSGNGRHVSNATLSTMPQLTRNAIASTLPVLDGLSGGGAFLLATAGSHTVPLPYSFSSVFKSTASNSPGGIMGGAAASVTSASFGVSAPAGVGNVGLRLNALGVVTRNVANIETAFHATQTVAISGSGNSVVNVDGSESTGTYSASFSAETIRVMREGSGGQSYGGKVAEIGFWASGLNSTQRGDLNTNQHGASGYNF